MSIAHTTSTKPLEALFQKFGWEAFVFQRDCWTAYLKGKSGLLHAPTGFGKSYAAFGGPVLRAMAEKDARSGLRVLWITPLRALANDIANSLQQMVDGVGLEWRVEVRHGDISSAQRQRQNRALPQVLVTTPESLTLLLSYANADERFARLTAVVCDEWHELLSTKRGTQTELALSRLRSIAPKAPVWGLSATIGNLDEARLTLLGDHAREGLVIHGKQDKLIDIKTLIPADIESFPWAGHLGLKQTQLVIERIQQARTTLVFTNTRSQCELWRQSLCKEAPELADQIGVHHGSLDRNYRTEVEQGLKNGKLRAVVCTSSLDLGVDFSPVEQVIQIGSPKGIARLVQRAGRSGHKPGATSIIYGVPTNAFELLEFAAAREAIRRGEMESRSLQRSPLDVLVQHVVTMSVNGSLDEDALRQEIQSTMAYRDLPDEDWRWTMGFAQGTVGALSAYPEHRRVVLEDGKLAIANQKLARRHRMTIGTITSDAEILVKYTTGKTLGQVEERFLTRLKPGDQFHFAGKRLELVRFRNMVATVRAAKRKAAGATPSWQGGRAPLSSELAQAVLREIESYADRRSIGPEVDALKPLLNIQAERSALPRRGYLLVEQTKVRRTRNIFIYAFAGRLVHEGLAALCAFRLSRTQPVTLKTTINDYGFSLQSARAVEIDESLARELLTPDNLTDDLLECMNATELARRQFREISRIAGLVFQGYPGQQKSARNLQMSSGLLYDVFAKYDADNLLLRQARREILERQLEQTRLMACLSRIAKQPIDVRETAKLTPFAFPLWAESLHEQVSSQSWSERIAEIAREMEA